MLLAGGRGSQPELVGGARKVVRDLAAVAGRAR